MKPQTTIGFTQGETMLLYHGLFPFRLLVSYDPDPARPVAGTDLTYATLETAIRRLLEQNMPADHASLGVINTVLMHLQTRLDQDRQSWDDQTTFDIGEAAYIAREGGSIDSFQQEVERAFETAAENGRGREGFLDALNATHARAIILRIRQEQIEAAASARHLITGAMKVLDSLGTLADALVPEPGEIGPALRVPPRVQYGPRYVRPYADL